MDRISKEHRSWNMSRIRGRDTSPERIVRSVLHRMGYRFRLQRRDLPGRPDIVLPKMRTVVFVHGCFWHRHRGCRFAYKPKTRVGFWSDKFEENVRRDKRVRRRLRNLRWQSLVIWECEVADTLTLSCRLVKRLSALAWRAGEPRRTIVPILTEAPSPRQARAWLRSVARAIGPGFHLDTDPTDYVDASGRSVLSATTASRLRRALDTVSRTLGHQPDCASESHRLVRQGGSGQTRAAAWPRCRQATSNTGPT